MAFLLAKARVAQQDEEQRTRRQDSIDSLKPLAGAKQILDGK